MRSVVLLVVLIIIAPGCLVQDEVDPAFPSAKEMFVIAEKEALTWNPDAQLVSASSLVWPEADMSKPIEELKKKPDYFRPDEYLEYGALAHGVVPGDGRAPLWYYMFTSPTHDYLRLFVSEQGVVQREDIEGNSSEEDPHLRAIDQWQVDSTQASAIIIDAIPDWLERVENRPVTTILYAQMTPIGPASEVDYSVYDPNDPEQATKQTRWLFSTSASNGPGNLIRLDANTGEIIGEPDLDDPPVPAGTFEDTIVSEQPMPAFFVELEDADHPEIRFHVQAEFSEGQGPLEVGLIPPHGEPGKTLILTPDSSVQTQTFNEPAAGEWELFVALEVETKVTFTIDWCAVLPDGEDAHC